MRTRGAFAVVLAGLALPALGWWTRSAPPPKATATPFSVSPTTSVYTPPIGQAIPPIVDVYYPNGLNNLFEMGRGRSCAAEDFDLDGWIDLFVGTARNTSYLRRNLTGTAGTLTFGEEVVLLDGEPLDGVGVADYDNDGDPDLWVGLGGLGPMPRLDRLYRNDLPGLTDWAGGMVDVTLDVGMVGATDSAGNVSPTPSFNGVWADFDQDGWVDLHTSTMSSPKRVGEELDGRNLLWRNVGGRRFEEVGLRTGIAYYHRDSRHSSWLDIDNDGDMDLYENNWRDRGVLWRNLFAETGRRTFQDITAAYTPPGEDLGQQRSYVSASADLNNDGWDDLVVFNRGIDDAGPYGTGHAVLLNTTGLGIPGFYNVADITGINAEYPRTMGVMGCQVADLDLDGYPDLFMGNGAPGGGQENNLWVSAALVDVRIPGVGTIVAPVYESWSHLIDAPSDLGPTYTKPPPPYPYRTHGTCLADFDNDGTIEMFVANGGMAGDPDYVREPDRLWKLLWPTPPAYLKVRLDGDGVAVSRDAIGARVAVTAHIGADPAFTIYQRVQGGNAFSAQQPRLLTVGLGLADGIDEVVVRWPNGVEQVVPGPHAIGDTLVVTYAP